MKLLIIGGTQFVGRHITEQALAAGHAVTLFNRGKSVLRPPGNVELRVGDRRGDLSALAQGTWDAVIDCCGYLPGEVERMARTLRGRVGGYVFISSVSAYASFAAPNDEDGATGVIEDPETEIVDGRTYGPLKALCEAAVLEHFGGNALLVRPGLVVGPHDPTQRFTWWPARIARASEGEQVLVPGQPDTPIQFIDARDLAAFVVHATCTGVRGLFNAVCPAGQWTMGDLIAACQTAAGVRVRPVWAEPAALEAQGLRMWVDMPLLPPADPAWAAFTRIDTARAQVAGLVCRPLEQTVRDTLEWYRHYLSEAQQGFDKAGLKPEREQAVLAALGHHTD